MQELADEAKYHDHLRVNSAMERATGKMVKPDFYGEYPIWASEINPNEGSAAATVLSSFSRKN